MKRFKKYTKNLGMVGNAVYAYGSHVAHVLDVEKKLFVNPEFVKYSVTTSKYINYVAHELGLDVLVAPRQHLWEVVAKHR